MSRRARLESTYSCPRNKINIENINLNFVQIRFNRGSLGFFGRALRKKEQEQEEQQDKLNSDRRSVPIQKCLPKRISPYVTGINIADRSLEHIFSLFKKIAGN